MQQRADGSWIEHGLCLECFTDDKELGPDMLCLDTCSAWYVRTCVDCDGEFLRRRIHGGRICGACRYYRRAQGRNVTYRNPKAGSRWRLNSQATMK